jgi:transcriptional regulator with XRE-family HTH domain
MKSTYQYRERDYTFGNLCLTLRTAIGLTQGDLARLLRVNERTIQAWEGGSSYPKVDVLKRFIELCVQHRAFALGREEEEIQALWKTAHQRVLLDELWLHKLLGPGPASSPLVAPIVSAPGAAFPRIDWVGARDVSTFTGREVELAELSHWIVQEHCRFIAILGMGGIGKSSLVSLLGHRLVGHFEAVLWRSVRDAPSCDDLVADCITFCSDTPPAEFPSSLEQRINQLVGRLQVRRCLLVLDNLETLLQEGDPEGNYRPGYEGYGRLVQRLAESAHQSCVVLTSREKPREIEALEGSRTPVRSLRLSGLSEEAARSLLEDKDLRGESSVWLQLIATYAGNPLALKIVGQAIVDLFGGDMEAFLQSGELIFNGIRAVLRQQVARLTPLEQTLLTWLAVVREWTSLDTLLSLQISRAIRGRVLEALEALSRRSLIERGQQANFTLQSVVMEYIIDALLDQLTEEIITQTMDHLRRYALEQAQAKDYVRESQRRLLVRPLIERLRAELRQDVLIEETLLRLLEQFRTEDAATQGYGPANVISLLKELRTHLRGLDFSRLSIRGAYLQGIEMQNAKLSGVMFRDTVFSDAFGGVSCVAISSDGRYWALGNTNGEVRIFGWEGRTLHLVLHAHSAPMGEYLAALVGTT